MSNVCTFLHFKYPVFSKGIKILKNASLLITTDYPGKNYKLTNEPIIKMSIAAALL